VNDTKKQPAVFSGVEELTEYLGIGRQAAYQALRRGQVPCLRLGRRFIIPRAAVDEWLRRAGEPRLEAHRT
jgi:excisionase family DNA binding protein